MTLEPAIHVHSSTAKLRAAASVWERMGLVETEFQSRPAGGQRSGRRGGDRGGGRGGRRRRRRAGLRAVHVAWRTGERARARRAARSRRGAGGEPGTGGSP